MWQTDTFGFNNDTAAGGFLNNTASETYTPQKSAVPRLHISIVPVVVRQIRDCQEDEFQLFGKQVRVVQIVGILREFEVQSTKATYRIEDHTGEIKAIWWLENDGDSVPNLPAVKEGHYVQLFGSVRNQDGGKIILVLKMVMVDDCNIVCNHLLQVIYTRFMAEKLSKSSAMEIAKNNPGAALANSMNFMNDNQHEDSDMGLTPIQEAVFKHLERDYSAIGMKRSHLLRNFPTNKHHKVNEALDFLYSEGHAYSTIDNNHFKATRIH